MFSDGEYKIGIYSKDNIKANTELLMDYGNSLSSKFTWIDLDDLKNYPIMVDSNDNIKHMVSWRISFMNENINFGD